MENNIAPLDNDTITRLVYAHAVAAYFGKTVDEMMR